MISAAVASTARADDFSDILADIQAEETAAATAFTTASTDFATNADSPAGLTPLFIGLDDDLVGVPNDLHVGLVDALTNTPVIPASDAAAVTEANTFYTEGNTLATDIVSLPSNDYAAIALDNALSAIDQWILPDQIQLIADLAYAF